MTKSTSQNTMYQHILNIMGLFLAKDASHSPENTADSLTFLESIQYIYKLLKDNAPNLFWPMIAFSFLLMISNSSLYFIIVATHEILVLMNHAMRNYQYITILFYIKKLILLYTLYDIIDHVCEYLSKYLSTQWIDTLENHYIIRIISNLQHFDNINNIISITSQTIHQIVSLASSTIISSLRLCVHLIALYLYQPHLILPCTYLFAARLLLNYALASLPKSRDHYFKAVPKIITQAINHKKVISSSNGENHLLLASQQIRQKRTGEQEKNTILSELIHFINDVMITLSYYYIHYSQLPAYLASAITLEQHTSNIHSITKILPHLQTIWNSYDRFRVIKTHLSEIHRAEHQMEYIEQHVQLSKNFISNPEEQICIHINNINIHAGEKKFHLSRFVLKPGDRIRITGPNGSGKSTIIDLLTQHILKDAHQLSRHYSTQIGSCFSISPTIHILCRPSRSHAPNYLTSTAELLHYPIASMSITEADKIYLFDYLNAMLNLGLESYDQTRKISYINAQISNDFENILGLKKCNGSSGQEQLMLGASFYLQIKRSSGPNVIIMDESCSNMDRSDDGNTTSGKKEIFINLILQAAKDTDAIITIDHDTNPKLWKNWKDMPISSVMTCEHSTPILQEHSFQ